MTISIINISIAKLNIMGYSVATVASNSSHKLTSLTSLTSTIRLNRRFSTNSTLSQNSKKNISISIIRISHTNIILFHKMSCQWQRIISASLPPLSLATTELRSDCGITVIRSMNATITLMYARTCNNHLIIYILTYIYNFCSKERAYVNAREDYCAMLQDSIIISFISRIIISNYIKFIIIKTIINNMSDTF